LGGPYDARVPFDGRSVTYSLRWRDLPTSTLVGLAVGPLVSLYGAYLVFVSLGILGAGPESRDTCFALLVGSVIFVAVAVVLSYRRMRPVRRVIGTAVTLTIADDGDVPTSVAGAMVLVRDGPARPREPRKNV
jgi:hypothetical protein